MRWRGKARTTERERMSEKWDGRKEGNRKTRCVHLIDFLSFNRVTPRRLTALK